MNCPEAISLIPLYLTGDIDEKLARDLNRHTRECHECANEISEQAAFDARVRAGIIADPVDSKAVEASILQLIALEKRRAARRPVFAAAGIAAALVAGFAGYLAIGAHTENSTAQGVFAAAARDHRMEIVERQPRRWRTDLASVSEIAAREGISAAMISSIAPPDYHFQEGKLCKLDGRLYLHLVYADATGNRNFSVFLDGQNSVGLNQRIFSSSLGSEHVAGFDKDKVNAMIVTDQSEVAALQFARRAESVI